MTDVHEGMVVEDCDGRHWKVQGIGSPMSAAAGGVDRIVVLTRVETKPMVETAFLSQIGTEPGLPYTIVSDGSDVGQT